MTYWANQPVKVNESIKVEMRNIIADPSNKKFIVPDTIKFKTITPKHYIVIHKFLSLNYIQDVNKTINLVYSRDFIYWYLKHLPNNMAVAITVDKTIVGFITALFINIKIDDKALIMPYVNFLCVSKKLRNCNLGIILIDEIKARICKSNSNKINYALFTSMSQPTQYFCKSIDYLVPVNYEKLIKVGFITENEHKEKMTNNPLILMKSTEYSIIIDKLNTYYSNLKIKVIFDNNSKYLLCSKKNIVYSFVNKSNNGTVTDFVNFYKYYYYCTNTDKIISIAKLGFYFCEQLTPTQLIEYLIDLLPLYNIDQLCINNMGNNDQINITKYSTNGSLNCFFYNISTQKYDPNQIYILPI